MFYSPKEKITEAAKSLILKLLINEINNHEFSRLEKLYRACNIKSSELQEQIRKTTMVLRGYILDPKDKVYFDLAVLMADRIANDFGEVTDNYLEVDGQKVKVGYSTQGGDLALYYHELYTERFPHAEDILNDIAYQGIDFDDDGHQSFHDFDLEFDIDEDYEDYFIMSWVLIDPIYNSQNPCYISFSQLPNFSIDKEVREWHELALDVPSLESDFDNYVVVDDNGKQEPVLKSKAFDSIIRRRGHVIADYLIQSGALTSEAYETAAQKAKSRISMPSGNFANYTLESILGYEFFDYLIKAQYVDDGDHRGFMVYYNPTLFPFSVFSECLGMAMRQYNADMLDIRNLDVDIMDVVRTYFASRVIQYIKGINKTVDSNRIIDKYDLLHKCQGETLEEDMFGIGYTYYLSLMAKLHIEDQVAFCKKFPWASELQARKEKEEAILGQRLEQAKEYFEKQKEEIEKQEEELQIKQKKHEDTIKQKEKELEAEQQRLALKVRKKEAEQESKTKQSFSRYEKAIAERDQDIESLRLKILAMEELNQNLLKPEPKDIDLSKIDISELQGKRFMFVGYSKNHLPELNRDFPNSVFIDSVNDSIKNIKVDAIVLITRFMSHSLLYKVYGEYRRSETPFIYCNGRRANRVYWEMLASMPK